MANTIYEWNFSDTKNRGKLWYIIAISVVLGLAIWWIFTKQYWLSFIVFLIAWISFFIENNSAEIVEINITELWIEIWDYFYDFSAINNFSFIYKWSEAILIRLDLNKKWIKRIDLKINNEICSDLKKILPNYIEEVKWWELSSSEKIINLLKL